MSTDEFDKQESDDVPLDSDAVKDPPVVEELPAEEIDEFDEEDFDDDFDDDFEEEGDFDDDLPEELDEEDLKKL